MSNTNNIELDYYYNGELEGFCSLLIDVGRVGKTLLHTDGVIKAIWFYDSELNRIGSQTLFNNTPLTLSDNVRYISLTWMGKDVEYTLNGITFKTTNLVNEIDPMAFIIINDAHEVLGEGFSKKVQ